MSYDLYFIATAKAPETDELRAHFAERPCFDVSEQQAVYENDATGTHFIWDFGGDDTAEADDPAAGACAVLFLNFYRPSSFADDAALEIAAFVSRFQTRIYDPQEDAYLSLPFDQGAFVATYCRHAARAAQSVATSIPDSDQRIRVPRALIHEAWTWNHQLEVRQSALGEDVFITSIWFVEHAGVIGTTAMWADAIPTLIPRVSYVVMPRKETAPRVGLLRRKRPVIELVPFAQFEQDFGEFFQAHDSDKDILSCASADHQRLQHLATQRPPGIHTDFEKLRPSDPFQIILTYMAIDREFFA